jgi:Holliday junction resolvasome RuvABC endonuclease subunit
MEKQSNTTIQNKAQALGQVMLKILQSRKTVEYYHNNGSKPACSTTLPNGDSK